jgi:hypothetical protein
MRRAHFTWRVVCPLSTGSILLSPTIVINRSVPNLRALLFALTLVAACSRDSNPPGKGAVKRTASARTRINDSAAGSVDLASPAYQPSPLSAIGAITGTIKLDGVVRADTTSIKIDEKVCGTHVPNAVEATPNGLADVIVWVADAKSGKPLPVDRRIELSSEDCLLDPRVQATVSGSTVNVFNDDKALHKLVFLDAATGDTLQRMPFFNNGQVVASEKLAKHVGIVEVRCVQHPWTRAYIATFDHPYFAVTEKDGKFAIDSLPPGKYTVNVWHEGMKEPLTQQVQVAANGAAKLALALKLQ